MRESNSIPEPLEAIARQGSGILIRAGFIGSNLIRSLKRKDWEIIVIDSLIEQVHSTGKWEVPEGVIFFQNDIKDKTAVANALDKVEYIVHLMCLPLP
jgi:nucleoside-diphosphate-sugar epimerase